MRCPYRHASREYISHASNAIHACVVSSLKKASAVQAVGIPIDVDGAVAEQAVFSLSCQVQDEYSFQA